MKDIPKEFEKWYLEDRLYLTEIAERCGCCQMTVYRWLKKTGLRREPFTKVENIKGEIFGKLIALEYIKNDKFGKALWLFRCDCGKEKVLNASAVKAGLTVSCGCYRHDKNSTGFELISGAFWHKLEKSANSRSIPMTITIQGAWEKFISQNRKCALSGVDISLSTNHNFSRHQTASPGCIKE